MADDKILFYTNPMSRGRIVHWMLEEAGAPYEVKVLDFSKQEQKRPEYLAVNPMGKMPAIVHRGTVVTETAAICAYLADAFAQAGLAPAVTDPARGTYFRWLFFGAGCVEHATVDRMFARPPINHPGALGYGSYELTFSTMEKALSPGPFLLGDRFSAADVYISSQLGWGMMQKGIEPKPAFQSYVARCHDRPAFKRFVEKSRELEAELKARG